MAHGSYPTGQAQLPVRSAESVDKE